MTPTNRLRFVERDIAVIIHHDAYGETGKIKPVRILQQLWRELSSSGVVIETEWIDVPLETEE